MRKDYDNIVYGASFAGIVYALKKSREGKKVLLLNKYGFPGGSVTECLNCLQKLPARSNSSLTGKLTAQIEDQKLYSFFISGEEVVFNPEVVKIVLQKELEESGVDLLFHVMPKSVKQNEEKLELTVLAKEGEISFNCSKAFDGTGEYHLNFLNGCKREVKGNYYFLFTTSGVDESYLESNEAVKSRLLNCGRYWVKLTIDSNNADFVDEEAQESLNMFSGSLKKGRVQLVPARAFTDYRLAKLKRRENILSAENITGKHYKPDEELIKALQLEKHLSGNG